MEPGKKNYRVLNTTPQQWQATVPGRPTLKTPWQWVKYNFTYLCNRVSVSLIGKKLFERTVATHDVLPVIGQVRNINQGNAGSVDKVLKGGGQWARKTLLPDAYSQKELNTEHEILKSLDHPHVLKASQMNADQKIIVTRTRDIPESSDEDEAGFVMVDGVDRENAGMLTELADGELPEFLPSLSQNEKGQCCHQLLDAMQYVHSKGIAHLDLKPNNILYSKGKGMALADFGLAQRVKNVLGRKHRIRANAAFEMKHAPPERVIAYLDGNTAVDGVKEDSWRLGITLIEILTGKSPFESSPYTVQLGNKLSMVSPGQDTLDRIQHKITAILDDNSQEIGTWKAVIRDLLTISPEDRITAREAYDRMIPHK